MDLLRHLTRIPGASGLWPRPHYGYGVNFAAELAGKLGPREVSVPDLGVAGGNGLLAMEQCAASIGAHHGAKVHLRRTHPR